MAFLGTTATMIAFINSLVAGVGVALLVRFVSGTADDTLGLVSGAASVVLLMSAFYLFQRWRFASTPIPSRKDSDRAADRAR